ncbi:MAG: PTS sugar transporter subunit IIA [Pseudomonadota bacterium]
MKFDSEAIVSGLRVADKKQLFEIISEQLAHVYGVDSQLCHAVLMDREAIGSTGFGRGIAIPHGRIDGISRPVGLFVQLDQPLDYSAVDAEPVDLVWALLSPQQGGADHLRALAHISRLMRDDALVSRVRGARELDAIHALLGEQLRRDAA